MSYSEKSYLFLEFSKLYTNLAFCNIMLSKNYDPNNLFNVHLPRDAIECLDQAQEFLNISKKNFNVIYSSDPNLYKQNSSKLNANF